MPMERGTLISIVTPCFNGDRFIQDAYASLRAQTYTNWEWLVVDDCSTDGSYSLLLSLAKNDQRIRVYRLEKNSGSAAARNYALRQVAGLYVSFLDIDDLIDATYLAVQAKFLAEKKGIVTCGFRVVSGGKKLSDYIPPKKITYQTMLFADTLSCLTTMFESRLLGDVWFADDLVSVEDYPFMLSLVKKVGIAYCNPVVLATYRRGSNSKTNHKCSLVMNFYRTYRHYCGFGRARSWFYVLRYVARRLFKYN